mmetsp:Transcript_16113/g.38851  ORF Transcript_16113/g.38851 Transcript_16113/m.38851 type:complete len:239 (-) Transcript_16113:212-928(-)
MLSVFKSAGSAASCACMSGPATSAMVPLTMRRKSEAGGSTVVCLPWKHHSGPSTRWPSTPSLPVVVTRVKCCSHAPQQKRECRSPLGLKEPPMSSRMCTGCGTWQREPAAHGSWQRAQESSPRTVLAASLPMMFASTSSAVAALSSSGGSVSRLRCFTARRSPDWRSTPKRRVDRVKQVMVPLAPLRSARPTRFLRYTARPISSARGDHSASTCSRRAPGRAPTPQAPAHESIGGVVA